MGFNRIFQVLRTVDDVSIDRALAAAVPTADHASLRLIATTLLDRHRPEGTVALVLHFHDLPKDLQEQVVLRVAEMYRPLREAAGLTQSRGPLNAIEIIRQARALRLAYLLSDQLRHGTEQTRREAAVCILELAQYVAGRGQNLATAPAVDATSAAYLQTAVEQSLEFYAGHRQPQVLVAFAALAPRAMPRIMQALSNPRHPAVDPLRSLLIRPAQRSIREALLYLMQAPTLTQTARAGLDQLSWPQGMGDVMHNAHLLELPRVRAVVQKIVETDRLLPRADVLPQLTAMQGVGLVRWIDALPMETHQRVEQLARLNRLSEPAARLAALRRLLQLAEQTSEFGINDVISGYCSDSDPMLARIALRHLIRVQWPQLPKILPKLINSPHQAVRRAAAEQLAPMAFDKLWQAWPKLDPIQRLSAGRAMIKIDPQFHRQLGERLAGDDQQDRLRALSMIRELNQGHLFEPALRVLIDGGDEKIASAAVSALATSCSPAAIDSLEAALKHKDSRVRANAIEALEVARSTRHVHQLVEMAHEEDNRPRANAIHALMDMRTSDALSALASMLNDQRSMQRISALWVVESMGLLDFARQVAEMSITDPDDQVKGKAHHTIEQLIALLQSVAAEPHEHGHEPSAAGRQEAMS